MAEHFLDFLQHSGVEFPPGDHGLERLDKPLSRPGEAFGDFFDGLSEQGHCAILSATDNRRAVAADNAAQASRAWRG
jgi:hypothetical protein